MCILCQQTSPKRWFGNRTMTSFCDVTNSAHQIQMATLCRWMKTPPWKVSAYAPVLWEPEDIAKRWEEYIASLFHDDREDDDDKAASYESGPSILKEVRWALQHCKPGKAAGPDEVVFEMLIALQEDGVDVLWSLFKNMYMKLVKYPPKCSNLFSLPYPKTLTLWIVKTIEPLVWWLIL